MVRAMAPLEPELIEADAAGMVSTLLARSRQRCLVVLLTDLNATALEEGLLPLLPQLTAEAPGDDRRGQRPAGERDGRGPRRRGGRLRRGRRRAGTAPTAGASPRSCAGTASRSSTPRRRRLAPALADAYLALKAAGRL